MCVLRVRPRPIPRCGTAEELAAAGDGGRSGQGQGRIGGGGGGRAWRGTRTGTTNRKRGDLRFTPAFSHCLRARTISVCAPAYNNLQASLLFSCGLGDTDHTKALCALLLSSLYCNQSQLMIGGSQCYTSIDINHSRPHKIIPGTVPYMHGHEGISTA